MSIYSNLFAIDCTPTSIGRRARLPLTIAGLLLTAQAQAFLPTPASLVTTGELALDTADNNSASKSQSAEPTLMAYTEPVVAESNNTIKPSIVSNTAVTSRTSNNQSANNTNSDNGAKTQQLLASWRTQAKTKNLAQHITWQRLLYFFDDQKNLIGKKKDSSIVDDAAFFLSKNGQHDSAAELDALLVALADEMTTTPDNSTANNKLSNRATKNSGQNSGQNSVLCRFPARVQWLTDTLNIDKSGLQVDCPELKDWMQKLAPEQLSIMFAQEYLDNPISAFAHTLLRIDSKASVADPSQIHHAVALNYTVGGDATDSFLVYAIKSMTGGYDNLIEIDSYPEKLAKYLQEDERDAWTYQLDLTPAEVQQIMLHVWETKDLKLPYYFTTDNCASEVLRLIDVVRPQQHLLSRLPYAVIPSDVVQLLNSEGLLASTNYTPADSTLRQAQLNKVKEQREQLGYHNSAKQTLNEIKSAQLNPTSSIAADGKTLLPRRIAVADNNPIDRHPLQLGFIGLGQRGYNNYIDLGLRAGYHDTLDRPSGFPQFFDLEGAAATLRLYDTDNDKANQPSSMVLQNVTLVRGRSFNPVNSAKKGKTWGASIEATRVNDGSQQEGSDHLVGSLGYETGWSWAFGTPSAGTGEMPPQLCYTLLAGTAQAGRGINKGYRVGAGVNAGCRYQINNQLRAQAELQLPYWYHGSSDESNARGHYWQPISTLGLQYDIDKKQALRLNANYEWQDRIDAKEDIQLSYRRYF
ncbi:Lnb N-terminal periplasmic domain-containing protein [Psychrobacter maritimus]|uniref:Lnb N-terminal periplasmic domain-containing protein n=1 Tax=Psychrobacter maritimus TaxID=256325 RepID=UPI001D10E441